MGQEPSCKQDLARLQAIVKGRVQGVGFRYFVEHHARSRGLTGYVRNLADGRSVEVVVEGPRQALDSLLGALHRGPRRSQVEVVEARWGEGRQEFQGFGIQ